MYTIDDLLRVMERLRDPVHGCPWDLKQDFRSIVPSTLEECYELAHAIEQQDFHHVGEELGDVLFQVIFYAQLGREQGLFSFREIVNTLVEKLVRRHPHVFADGEIEGIVSGATSVDEVNASWEAIKARERGEREQHGVLDDVPVALPALPRAQKLQKRAAGVGFDWPDPLPVLAKLEEEIEELRQALAAGEAEAVRDEVGDLLFTCVNLSRQLKLDSEAALRASASKFERRFRQMEGMAKAAGTPLDSLDDTALDALWERAKEGKE
ncbi:nucleoside triphosphate pyrophosphohydrolase [Seongchinamella sediminis]|uniref:Nucleoside triphosphate pyrophosphohydrolase n=2 Tax=Seongchinamella sediminis TaxID=2283635 RepID=A0A3L7DWJ6_9GAMM|nr:nucleoside triphosphate pyrophosphohydrolase [Seongchinamella sediminis]